MGPVVCLKLPGSLASGFSLPPPIQACKQRHGYKPEVLVLPTLLAPFLGQDSPAGLRYNEMVSCWSVV